MWNDQGGDQGYGGDQGGGYINSPGQFSSPSGAAGGDRKGRQRAQNIMPCTVAQVLSATQVDDKFIIDNIDLHQVTIVGMVRTVNETATRLDYQIDDMTGPPLEVKQFVDNDENTPDAERTLPMRENTYVRVFGNLRSFQGKRSLNAFKIVPVMDMNEIATHMLEVIHAHLALTKAQGMAMDASMTAAQGGNKQPLQAQDVNAAGYAGAQPVQGLTPMQQQVLFVIRGCTDEQGISVAFVSDKLRGSPQSAIRDAVEFLSSEGHIYSTIDDDHFKSTDSM